MINFPAHIPLGFIISSDPSICSTVAFAPLENSDHVVVSVSFDFLSKSKGNATFHCLAFDYYCTG